MHWLKTLPVSFPEIRTWKRNNMEYIQQEKVG